MSKNTTDELREVLELFRKQCVNKGNGIGFEEAASRLEQLISNREKLARINMVDYFDQCPANELMDWKGLFADTRKLLEAEQPLRKELDGGSDE